MTVVPFLAHKFMADLNAAPARTGLLVYVHTARTRGLPSWLLDTPIVVLQYGRGLAIPTLDLEVDSVGIFATLAFQRTACAVEVPWEAVLAWGQHGRPSWLRRGVRIAASGAIEVA